MAPARACSWLARQIGNQSWPVSARNRAEPVDDRSGDLMMSMLLFDQLHLVLQTQLQLLQPYFF